MQPPDESVEFLRALWGERAPGGLYVQLWGTWLKPGGQRQSRTSYLQHWTGVPAVRATHADHDLYVGCAAVAKSLGASVRGKAKDAAAIPGLWLDVDVGKKGAPETREAALAVCSLLLPPTLVIDSGHGYHAWWLFDAPWIFADADEREQAAAMAKGWELAHVTASGFKLDPVGELARVLRLPGTLNHKGDAPTSVTAISTLRDRFPREAFADHVDGRSKPSPATEAASLTELPSADDIPLEAIRAMREADDVFARTWQRKRKGAAADWSDSEYDLSILTMLIRSGMAEPAAVAAAQHSRREYGDPEKADKAERLDYWRRTLAAAKRGGGPDAAVEDLKREETRLVADLRELRETPPNGKVDMPGRWAKLNQLTGAGVGGTPHIVEWHQYGTDPNTAVNVWKLSDGTDVPLGTMHKVLHQGSVKAALATVSNILRPGTWKSATWELGINTCLPLREYHQAPEDERDQRALEWVAQVIGERNLETNPEHLNEVILRRLPFLRDDRIYVTQSYLGQQLRALRIAPDTKDPDLAPMLRAAGFERGSVNFDKDDGGRGSRSYWSVEQERMP
jgi:hypothetical protein